MKIELMEEENIFYVTVDGDQVGGTCTMNKDKAEKNYRNVVANLGRFVPNNKKIVLRTLEIN